MTSNKKGYILILTFFFIALSVVLITGVLKQAMNFQKNAGLMRNKEKAKLLVLSGVQLAMDQLSLIEDKEASQEGEKPSQPNEKEIQAFLVKWFGNVFPVINKWHAVALTDQLFGVDGYIKYFISCEQGKIDLNNFANILEKESKQTTQQTKSIDVDGKTEVLASQDSSKIKSFSSVIDELVKKEFKIDLISALKEAKNFIPLEDPTQLLKYKSFEPAKNSLFLPLNNNPADKGMPLTVMDLFTTLPSSGKLNPWFLSYSMAKVLGLQRKPDVKLTDMVKQFKPKMEWEKEWDKTLAELYGKQFKSMPKEITTMFSSECEATAFSVIVYAKVGPITQRLYAILERENPDKMSRKNIVFKITKIFWF